MRNSIILIMGIALISCSESDSSQSVSDSGATSPTEVRKEPMVALDLSTFRPLVEISVPDRSQQGVDPTVNLDELSGYLTISAGKNFQIILREEPTTLEDIRQEIENEMMWENAITPIEEHSMIITRALPDGSMEQHHFASVLPGVGGNDPSLCYSPFF